MILNINIYIYMRSIIKRVGGKSKLKKFIVSLIPPHKLYIEAFVGGGSVFFEKDPSEYEVINDLDKDISDIYKDMKAVGEQMINKDFSISRIKFNRLKNQKTFNSKADLLYRNLYLSLNSFRGDRKNFVGEKEIVYRGDSDSGKKYKTTDFKDRLKNVIIKNNDWKTIIKNYDSKDTFFYLDPPYSMAKDNKDYNNNDVTIDELYNTLKNIKGKFLLSYDFNPDIKNKFKGFNKKIVKTQYETKGDKIDKREYLIANYNIH